MKLKLIPTIGAVIFAAAVLPISAADVNPAAPPPSAPPTVMEAVAAAKPVDVNAALAFIPEVVAKYGQDKTVSGAEVKKMLTPFLKMAAEQGKMPSPEEIRMAASQALQAMVDIEVLKAQCEKDGITTQKADAEKKLAEMAEQNGGAKAMEEGLKKAGMTKDELVDRITTQMSVSRWVDEKIKPGVKISDEEIQKFYDENKANFQAPEQLSASHILIKVDENADAAAKKTAKDKAEKILADLKGGADFAKLAQANSDCPSGKQNGGSLGSFQKGQMVPEFEAVAAKLKKDELSGVVETQFGFHIIKGGDSKPASVTALAEVKPRLQEYLVQRELQKVMKSKVEELRKAANVQIFLAEPKMPAMPGMPAMEAGK